MAHAILAYGNRADSATLSGGDWEATLPLTNLQDRRLGRVARTDGVDSADTKFDADFGAVRLFRVVSLVGHNGSLTGTCRFRLSNDPTFATSLADSGVMDIWPSVYPTEVLDWFAENYWTGQYTDEERSGYTAAMTYVLPTTVAARYLRVEIDDEDNADGYLQFGRLFAADGWQPVRNMVYGAQIGWTDRTEVQEAISGAEYFDVRTPARSVQFGLEAMDEDEAMARGFEFQRQIGVSGECFFIWDPDDTVHALRRQFLCRPRTLSMIEHPGPNRWRAPYELKELL